MGACRVCLILIDDLKVDVVNLFFTNFLDNKSSALKVAEGVW